LILISLCDDFFWRSKQQRRACVTNDSFSMMQLRTIVFTIVITVIVMFVLAMAWSPSDASGKKGQDHMVEKFNAANPGTTVYTQRLNALELIEQLDLNDNDIKARVTDRVLDDAPLLERLNQKGVETKTKISLLQTILADVKNEKEPSSVAKEAKSDVPARSTTVEQLQIEEVIDKAKQAANQMMTELNSLKDVVLKKLDVQKASPAPTKEAFTAVQGIEKIPMFALWDP